MTRYCIAAFLTCLTFPQVGAPQQHKLAKNHVTVLVSKAIDSAQASSWQVTGQVKDAATIGRLQIPAGSDAVVALVSTGSREAPNLRLALISIMANGQAIPVNSSIAIPGKTSPMFNISAALQGLAAQKRNNQGANSNTGASYESVVEGPGLSVPRVYIPLGEALEFVVSTKQIQLDTP